ncbi:MAG: radical SAM protein [Ignavibacteria bacterium]|nr:radical SAM protein [Ignavibacteria bacterium]
MNIKALINTLTTSAHTLPIAVLYVTERCNLRCITCSYRAAAQGELSLKEIEDVALVLSQLGLRHIVYSGGEPLVRQDFPSICKAFAHYGVRQTLLTNGILLRKRLAEIRTHLSEIVVSLDGADARTHDGIRGATSFEHILEGMRLNDDMGLFSIRTVLQKQNFRQLKALIALGRSLSVRRISFLAADVSPDAFGREAHGPAAPIDGVALTSQETHVFRKLVDDLAVTCKTDFTSGFITESPQKLFQIVQYYEALAGIAPFPPTYCNAPMISCVITSTGDLLPCFFLPRYGNIRTTGLRTLINSPGIRRTRRDLRRGNLNRCKTCVCTLHVQPVTALLDRFA